MTEQQGTWIIDLLKQILQRMQRMEGAAKIDADTIALEAAKNIEDIFAMGCPGGRTQRLARIQVEVRAALAKAVIPPRPAPPPTRTIRETVWP